MATARQCFIHQLTYGLEMIPQMKIAGLKYAKQVKACVCVCVFEFGVGRVCDVSLHQLLGP